MWDEIFVHLDWMDVGRMLEIEISLGIRVVCFVKAYLGRE